MFLIKSFNLDLITIILILGVVAYTIAGIFKGFFRVLIDLTSSILSSIVSLFLAKPVGMFIYNLGTFNKLIDKTTNFLISKQEIFSLVATQDNKKDLIDQAINEFNIPSFLEEVLRTIGNNYINIPDGSIVGEYISNTLFIILSTALAGLVMYIIISIIVIILEAFLHKLDKIKPINKFNHTLGGVVGFVNGLIFVFIFMVIISVLLMVPMFNEQISNIMKLSNDNIWTLSKWLYQFDLLGILLKLIGF